MHEEYTEIKELLCKITGTAELDMRFGKPFFTAFSVFSGKSGKEIAAASYICTLFLSCLIYRYPTSRLHTFVNIVKEEYGVFTFNCNAYEDIYSCFDIREISDVMLFDSNGNIKTDKLTKQYIFEAFDFYTNR